MYSNILLYSYVYILPVVGIYMQMQHIPLYACIYIYICIQ